MFNCDHCKQTQPAHSSSNKITVQHRAKTYPKRYQNATVIDQGGHGHEIVREITVCDSCYEKLTQTQKNNPQDTETSILKAA